MSIPCKENLVARLNAESKAVQDQRISVPLHVVLIVFQFSFFFAFPTAGRFGTRVSSLVGG
jgi:hypothetical protein